MYTYRVIAKENYEYEIWIKKKGLLGWIKGWNFMFSSKLEWNN